MTSRILWTASEVAAVTGGSFSGDNIAIHGIAIDTRHIEKGDLFIALKGPNFDGNDFVEAALEQGAAAVVTTKSGNPSFITVNDTFRALQDLGAGGRARSSAAIIAVTGSVGKTSVKSMLQKAFSPLGETHAAEASLNNHWGVPLSLARMPMEAEFAIFEIGMNHANEITPLSKMVAPHISIITTIASAHIQHLGSIENIALAKAEIFHGMEPDGIAILPRDSEQFSLLLAEARTNGLQNIVGFGQHPESDIRLLSIDDQTLSVSVSGKEIQFDFGMPGVHQAVNALSVVAALVAVKADLKIALQSFSEMIPVSGRGNLQEIVIAQGQAPVVVIDETHNASPVAVKAALAVMAKMPTTRRVVILGDMLEMGDNGPAIHAELAEAILAAKPDLILLSGPLMAHLAKVLPTQITHHYPTSTDLSASLKPLINAGDLILVKGSRGSKMKLVVDALGELGQFKAA